LVKKSAVPVTSIIQPMLQSQPKQNAPDIRLQEER
jgi:hypothetical protein